jgi:TetR/AcrR family acrAB operon transcriptional repressor
MARKTKAEALTTRNRILDAAEQMFCTRGVARTSLHEIADSISLTRGAVYWHFKGKYDLLTALWERCMLPIDQAFDEIDAELADDPLARIRAKSRRVFHRIVHDQRTQNLLSILLLRCEMVDEIRDAQAHILAERQQCLGKMAGEFRAAIALGQLPAGVDARLAAIGLHALVNGLSYDWLMDPGSFDLPRTAAFVVDRYLAGLAASVLPGAARKKPSRRRSARRSVAVAR